MSGSLAPVAVRSGLETMTMHIEITRIHPDAVLPRYQTGESAGFDLCSMTDVTVQPGKVALMPTGLVIHVPQRMFLGIFARSSTPLKVWNAMPPVRLG